MLYISRKIKNSPIGKLEISSCPRKYPVKILIFPRKILNSPATYTSYITY